MRTARILQRFGLTSILLWGLGAWASVPNPSAAQPEPELDLETLQGRWQLESVDGLEVDASPTPYFELVGQQLRGFDGCNTFGGALGGRFGIRAGQRACPGDYVSLPLDLMDPIGQLRRADRTNGVLTLPLPGGEGVAILRLVTAE